MPAGRPVVWTPERKAEACERILREIASSELGLDHICNAAKPDLPDAGTFYDWKLEDEELEAKYTRAREQQQQFCTDNAAVLAMQLVARKPAYSIDPAAFRAYLDAVKWRASKLAPKMFGDKQTLEHTGAQGKPLDITVTFGKDVTPKSE